MSPRPMNPKDIAQAGEKIYREKFKQEYEQAHAGRFVAINVITETATLGDNPESALEAAVKLDPEGVFHLIRVGFASAFQVGYAAPQTGSDWLFE